MGTISLTSPHPSVRQRKKNQAYTPEKIWQCREMVTEGETNKAIALVIGAPSSKAVDDLMRRHKIYRIKRPS